MMKNRLAEVFKSRILKVNSNKKKVLVLGGEERSVCEFNAGGRFEACVR